jgi:pimeloyl-ACP methyl ester carboxylesterase
MKSSRLQVLRQGTGPVVLMLHGIGASETAWKRQIDQLDGEFTCVAPNLPGYGHSPDPIAPGFEPFVDEVAGVLNDLPVHIVGVSFGALCAIGLARRHHVWTGLNLVLRNLEPFAATHPQIQKALICGNKSSPGCGPMLACPSLLGWWHQ